MNTQQVSLAEYQDMSRQQRAVVLAKDVIEIIKAERAVARCSGRYLYSPVDDDVSETDDAKTVLATKKCEVCAKGGLLLARIDRFNGITVGELCEFESGYGNIESDGTDCSDILSRDLHAETIHAIEAAYEGQPIFGFDGNDDADDMRSTPAWEEKYEKESDRMTAIMERVIANGGTFTMHDVKNP